MKTSKFIIGIIILFLFSSCVTIFYGRKQKISVNSQPSGARVYVNGEDTKQITPCTIKVNRKQPKSQFNNKNELNYVLKKENYYDAEYRDVSSISLIPYYLDYVCGVAPLIFDFVNGSTTRSYSNKNVLIKLNEAGKVIVKTDTIVKKEVVYVNAGKPAAYQFEKKSDVDVDIPHTGNNYPYRFALIIGNEDYSSHQIDLSSEINVDYAKNDASAFKEYAINTLGIPERNLIFLLDATTGQMNQGISKLNLILKNTQGNADVFVYYAGHGLPDEQTKEAYIMPVDVSGKNASEGIKLKDMYNKLTEYPSKRITVFIDACFSGGARNQGLLAARGVKVKAKEDVLNANLVVFTASSDVQSSLSYKEQKHGFFTYFLLKKLQESKGDVNYSELSKYIMENVSLQSILINDKEQSPQVNVSNSVANEWGNYKIK